MRWKIRNLIVPIIFILLITYAYSQQVFTVGTYHGTGPTLTIFGRGAPSIVYQVLPYGIDSLFVKLEGTMDSATYGFTNLSASQNDSITFYITKRDTMFFIRYDGEMPMTRVRICRIVPDTVFATSDTTVRVRGYYEDR
jgi:hypothetical protein